MNISKYNPSPYFEENLGQLPRDIKYKAKLKDYITFFTEDKLIVSLPSNLKNTSNVFYMKLENKNNDIYINGQEKQIGIINYLIGNDESKWINDIHTYSKVKYEGVYDNIDLYYYINNNNIEYDFVLLKGANYKDISISFEGVDNIEIGENEDIVFSVGDISVILLKPKVYQIIDNIKIHVDCKYILDENKLVSFLVSEYEEEFDLVLDPVLKLDYSTYIGGTNCDYANSIAVDSEGCVYITGYTEGEYPTTINQIGFGGGSIDAFVTKLNADFSDIVYSTYIGGSSADYSNGIVIDSTGCAYITGGTESDNFPITNNSYQTTYGGNSDVFVSKLDSSGRILIYSTYIGSSTYNVGNSIAIDSIGCAYITGRTEANYPVTEGAHQTNFTDKKDVFVTKLNEDGSSLIYSTYLGGTDYDSGNSIAVDKCGCAYITGYAGVDYPVTKGAYQTTYGGDVKDAFVSKINEDGSSLIYSTYLGGSKVDQGNSIAIDDEGCAYITGYTQGRFPTINAYKFRGTGYRNAFITKISKDGSYLVYSTYLASGSIESGYSITVDSDKYAYVTGYVTGDIFVCKLSREGKSLMAFEYVKNGNNDYGRGIAVDTKGNIYISGYAESGYPTTVGAYKTTCGGGHDAIVSKISIVDCDLVWDYKPSKVKLFDTIKTKLSLTNLSPINIDVNIKYQPLDSSLVFLQDSLFIQNINHKSNNIPEEIYLSSISPQNTIEIVFDLKYIIEKFPQGIPINIIIEIYDSKTEIGDLIESITNTFYIDTIIGTNYIPGCNYDLYNLEIDKELQTTSSGVPIIYYKSGSEYIYIEPDEDKYIYKVLSNPIGVIEIPISV